MDPRRNLPSAYDDARMARRGPLPPIYHHMEPLPAELLEDKLASQAAEIEQLTADNRKLAASYMTLRDDLFAAKDEAEKIREHMRSIQNEGDIQIRILLDKIAKTEANAGVGDRMKKELQAAHAEARSLMTTKLELSAKLEQSIKELDNSCEDIEKNPEMRSELESLRQEYQRLRKTFENEKCSNVEKVEQLKILEKDLIGIAAEVERLRGALLNAEKRASALISYNSSCMNLDNRYPFPYHGNGGGYTDRFRYGGAMDMMNPYASNGFPVGPQVNGGHIGSTNVGAANNGAWGGVYNSSSPAVGAQVSNAPVSSTSGNAVCEEVGETCNAPI